MLCVSDTHLEAVHADKSRVRGAGELSDVIVVDADGTRNPWPGSASYQSEDEMRGLNEGYGSTASNTFLCAPVIQNLAGRDLTVVFSSAESGKLAPAVGIDLRRN